MVEPVSAALLLTAGYVGQRTLGPTLDTVGKELEAAAAPRVKNLLSIVERANARGGDAADDESIHPRVLSHFVNEGSWVDDAVHQEYVAGMLLTARSTDADDEQLESLQAITSMTRRQVLLHHVSYWALAQGASNQVWGSERARMTNAVVGESADVTSALGCGLDDADFAADSMNRADLLKVACIGTNSGAQQIWADARGFEHPFLAAPTILGINVFLGGYGVRPRSMQDLNAIDWTRMSPIGPVAPDLRLGSLANA